LLINPGDLLINFHWWGIRFEGAFPPQLKRKDLLTCLKRQISVLPIIIK